MSLTLIFKVKLLKFQSFCNYSKTVELRNAFFLSFIIFKANCLKFRCFLLNPQTVGPIIINYGRHVHVDK